MCAIVAEGCLKLPEIRGGVLYGPRKAKCPMTTPSAGGPRGVHAHRVSRRSQLDRNIDHNSELLARFGGARVSVPALHIAGDRDFVVSFPGMHQLIPTCRRPFRSFAGQSCFQDVGTDTRKRCAKSKLDEAAMLKRAKTVSERHRQLDGPGRLNLRHRQGELEFIANPH